MLTPLDLNSKTFAKSFRGYDMDEVQEFFAQVAKDYERLYHDNVELKDTVERVSAKLEYYQQMEGTMQSTLTVAQETAEEVKRNNAKKSELKEKELAVVVDQKTTEAEAYAQKTRSDADLQAKKIRDEADAYAAKVRSEADNYASRIKSDVESEAEKLKSDTQSFVDRMKHLAEIDVAKVKISSDETSKKLLADAREQAHTLVTEATERSRKLLADAETESRDMRFDAETKAAAALNVYETQIKKLAMNRNTIIAFLESQIDNFKNFAGGTSDGISLDREIETIQAAKEKILGEQQVLAANKGGRSNRVLQGSLFKNRPGEDLDLAVPKFSVPVSGNKSRSTAPLSSAATFSSTIPVNRAASAVTSSQAKPELKLSRAADAGQALTAVKAKNNLETPTAIPAGKTSAAAGTAKEEAGKLAEADTQAVEAAAARRPEPDWLK
jgi:cell division initiation protein